MVGRNVPRAPAHLTNGADNTTNNLPPPSTIAAQLVKNHAEFAPGSRQIDNSATFRQLLQEILNRTSAPENDVEVNHKLIHVVVEAGLDVLLQDNPFAQWDVLLPQAIDSLAVVESTIARQPDILLYEDSTLIHRQPNLLAWLFPKILSLSSHHKGATLQQGLQNLLKCMMICLSKTLDLWQYCHAMLDTFQDCVADIMLIIDSDGVLPSFTTITAYLPPVRSLARLWPDAQQAVALPPGCQMHVKSEFSGFKISLLFLSATLEIFSAGQSSLRLRIASNALLAWILDVIPSLNSALLKNRQHFESHQQFDLLSVQILQLYRKTVSHLLVLPHAVAKISPYDFARFSDCCSDYIRAACEHSLSFEVQHEVAQCIESLLDISSSHPKTSVEEFLLPACLAFVAEESRFQAGLSEFVQGMCKVLLRSSCELPDWVVDIEGDTTMADDTMTGPSTNISTSPRREKRRLRSIGQKDTRDKLETSSSYSSLLVRFARLLGSSSGSDIGGLSHVALTCYGSLSEHDREQLWLIAAACPCATSEGLQGGRCMFCHEDRQMKKPLAHAWNDGEKKEDWREMLAILKQLQESHDLHRSNKHRVLALLAVRSFVMHTTDLATLDLGSSFLAEWCLRCLHGSSKELRIAAGRTLVAFLRSDLPREIRDNNRRLALEFLRTLSARDMTCHHETLILTWGQIAVVCGERELNLALLHLVDYLGHPNSLVCALAFSELEAIAECLSLSPRALVGPYYRSIAVAVVQDLNFKPQKIQQLVDFLEMSVNNFLDHTQRETIPFLVLSKKTDILERIASARHPNTSVQDLILSPPANLSAVLAFLLAQPSSDVEHSTWAHLIDIAPGLESKIDLASLIKLDPVLIACEMLKAAADEDEANLTKAYHSIQQFALIAERRPGQSRTNGKSGRMLATFFDAHVLGIMTVFSNTIEQTRLHLSEKVRCIQAIEQMIKLAQTNIVIGLPQVRACLQFAAEQNGLQDAAMSAWIALISTLDGPDVVDLVDQLFALVVQHWSELSSEIQQAVYDSIGEMLKSHSNLIREKVITMPSLASIPLMSKFESEIQRLKEHEVPENHLRAFVQRLMDDNISIVKQALQELVPWLESNQSLVHEATVSEQPKAVIADISRALLDVCTKYATHSQDVVGLSARCMGIIGCLDPNRVDAPSSRRQALVLSNFEKASEVIDWVAIMLEDVIVPAFKSTTNTRAQGFLAYVMQELVRFCEFNEVVSVRLRASQASPAYLRWMDMPESVRNTLTPFLSSRYFLNTRVDVEPNAREYPVFSRALTYRGWLQTWVYDMMWRGKGENAEMVFPVLARIVRGHDLSVSSFLLPYVALNIVIGGTEKEAKDVAAELLTVLSTESSVESERETLRQCSEVC